MSDTNIFRRGDVVLLNFPLATDLSQAKLRPAVVVQNNIGNQFSPNLIVIAISSKLPRKNYPTSHIIRHSTPVSSTAGLDRDSVVMAQVILTVPKKAVVRTIGSLDANTLTAIDDCMRVSLGL